MDNQIQSLNFSATVVGLVGDFQSSPGKKEWVQFTGESGNCDSMEGWAGKSFGRAPPPLRTTRIWQWALPVRENQHNSAEMFKLTQAAVTLPCRLSYQIQAFLRGATGRCWIFVLGMYLTYKALLASTLPT